MTAQHHSNEDSKSARIRSERDARLGHASSASASRRVAPWWPFCRDVLSGYVLSRSVMYKREAGNESAVLANAIAPSNVTDGISLPSKSSPLN